MNACYFTKFDFRNVYHRIRIRKKNEWKTTFRIRYDHFEYAIMSFELFNVFVIFQTKINKILRKLMNYLCVIYFDDILIYFKTKKKHWRIVKQMLTKLRKFKFFVKLFKCVFMIQSMKFLNYIINNHDVFMNFDKMKFIRTWFHFIFLQKMQMFLNFANFYRRFVEFYAKITRFFIELLKKKTKKNKMIFFVWQWRSCNVRRVYRCFYANFYVNAFWFQKSNSNKNKCLRFCYRDDFVSIDITSKKRYRDELTFNSVLLQKDDFCRNSIRDSRRKIIDYCHDFSTMKTLFKKQSTFYYDFERS